MSFISASHRDRSTTSCSGPWCPGESLRVRKPATFVIVEFGFESDRDGEDDGTAWIAKLFG
jgi:hypothetical protein